MVYQADSFCDAVVRAHTGCAAQIIQILNDAPTSHANRCRGSRMQAHLVR